MELNRASFARLHGTASRFGTDNHRGYLAEALQCVQETKDPIAALRLLHALWGSPLAHRSEQKLALNDVGKWLEDRLYQEPAISHGAIAQELGWLRRMATIVSGERKRHEGQPDRRTGNRPPKMERAFGMRLSSIAERQAALVKQAKREHVAPPPPAPPAPPPDRLPSFFEAQFADFFAARDARRTARERAKRGKEPKERLLEIRPLDTRLSSLAAGLVCSVHGTDGFDAVFAADRQRFYVTAIEDLGDGKKLAKVITLEPPKDGGT